MNYCIVSGQIVGDIDSELNKEMSCTKFNIKNLYYKPNKSSTEKAIIRCICYGALADYVYNELYEGANILVTGRVLNRHYVSNGVHLDRLYIGCTTVSILEQEEYS
jgi:single-stranded DNA-binding protein